MVQEYAYVQLGICSNCKLWFFFIILECGLLPLLSRKKILKIFRYNVFMLDEHVRLSKKSRGVCHFTYTRVKRSNVINTIWSGIKGWKMVLDLTLTASMDGWISMVYISTVLKMICLIDITGCGPYVLQKIVQRLPYVFWWPGFSKALRKVL